MSEARGILMYCPKCSDETAFFVVNYGLGDMYYECGTCKHREYDELE